MRAIRLSYIYTSRLVNKDVGQRIVHYKSQRMFCTLLTRKELVLCKHLISSRQLFNIQTIKQPIMFSSNLSKPKSVNLKSKSKNINKSEIYDQLTAKKAEKKSVSQAMQRRRLYEKLTLNSYLGVCVDVGQINRAFNILLEYGRPKMRSVLDVQHYNIVLKGWAKLNSIPQIVETRMHMIRNLIEPNAETFAYILLGYSKNCANQRVHVRKLITEMKRREIDPRNLFQSTYLSTNERKMIKNLLKTVDPAYDDIFCGEPIDYDCKLMNRISEVQPTPHDFGGSADLSKIRAWADHQRMIESKPSINIKSIAHSQQSNEVQERYSRAWQKFHDMWRLALTKSLNENLESLQKQCSDSNKIHLYPYLCSIDKNLIINILLDEIEINAAYSNYSFSTVNLHLNLGNKIMIKYLRAKSIADGSHQERQTIYNQYLSEYISNPIMMGKMNSREFLQTKALATKNYAIYKDRISPVEHWPHHIVAAVGRFLYGLLLREVKFDPDVVRNPKKEIKQNKLVHAFYTAYFQINCTHKIKEEFRAHQEFENFHQKACAQKLKFDYSYLPTSSPPFPWLSYGIGGYLTNKSDLVRLAGSFAENEHIKKQQVNHQKLYPSLDSLNAIGLCPWIVNADILNIIIELFRAGGDTNLKVPLDAMKMEVSAPKLKDNATKADKILFNKEKKKYEQKRREMYSLWRDCLYRLSIANHFRDRIFWFPHNMDFRGRTYPIPPHFNHLGSDLPRSLLLFAKGQPLGPHGLDWLKIHLINLVGSKKSSPLKERLEYANSILHLEILDSADNPWDGRKWWTNNENPWQVLACCKEIAKAIRSKDHTKYVSHFPVHQDGSCNGLQHYAALGRDYNGAMAVNLIPCDKPQDVYSRVVEIVENMRSQDAAEGNNIAKQLEGFVQRKVIKQTVMTTVYGVTRYGARHQIARQLYTKKFPEKDVWQAAHYLATKTFDSIGQMFNKSRLIQDWLNECAYIIASRCKQPVSWETPLGFLVIQPYTQSDKLSSNRLVSTSLKADLPLLNDPLSRLNTGKQKTAFPPNYIHSLDSSHMMLTSLFCLRHGLTFVSVHDCYWTHPSTVNKMNEVCRQQFVSLHSEPLLQNLSDQFIEKFGKFEQSRDEDIETISETTKKKRMKQATPKKQTLQGESDNLTRMLSTSGEYYDKLVDEDLRSLINEDRIDDDLEIDAIDDEELGNSSLNLRDALHIDQSTQPLIKLYDSTLQSVKQRSCATFKEVPQPGDLKLDNVLKSTYFFS